MSLNHKCDSCGEDIIALAGTCSDCYHKGADEAPGLRRQIAALREKYRVYRDELEKVYKELARFKLEGAVLAAYHKHVEACSNKDTVCHLVENRLYPLDQLVEPKVEVSPVTAARMFAEANPDD